MYHLVQGGSYIVKRFHNADRRNRFAATFRFSGIQPEFSLAKRQIRGYNICVSNRSDLSDYTCRLWTGVREEAESVYEGTCGDLGAEFMARKKVKKEEKLNMEAILWNA